MTGLNKYRIVLADDHVLIRHGIKNMLVQEDDLCIVGEVSDGEELLVLLEQKAVDLLILDISMPKLSGIEVIGHVKEKYPWVKILMLTMHKDKDRFFRAMTAGADGYLIKEDSAGELLQAINRIKAGKSYLSPMFSEGLADDVLNTFRNKNLDPFQELTVREKEVLKLVVEGKTSKDIADCLGVSFRTVDHHRANLLRKFKMKSSIDLVNYAVRHSLFSPAGD
jgi:DNA-binding NarL/FixJ family response regulator